jgi:DNA-binding NtrC family response regulator
VLEEAEVRLDMAPSRRSLAAGESPFLPPGMTLDEFERSLIREALRRAGGNKSQAARLLGLTRNALRYRLTQMGEADPETATSDET